MHELRTACPVPRAKLGVAEVHGGVAIHRIKRVNAGFLHSFLASRELRVVGMVISTSAVMFRKDICEILRLSSFARMC